MSSLPKLRSTMLPNDQIAVTLAELEEIMERYEMEGLIIYIGRHAEHGDVIIAHPAADQGLLINLLQSLDESA